MMKLLKEAFYVKLKNYNKNPSLLNTKIDEINYNKKLLLQIE